MRTPAKVAGALRRSVERLAGSLATVRTRVGVAVDHDGVAHVVAVRRGRVLWSRVARLDAAIPPSDALAAALADLPRATWPTFAPSISVAPPAARVQVKAVTGLPRRLSPAALRQVVQHTVRRYFLCGTAAPVVGRVRPVSDEVCWAAAFDGTYVAALRSAARAARTSVHRVVPPQTALGWSVAGDRAVWIDGGDVFEAAYRDRRLDALRRLGPGARDAAAASPTLVPPLARIGDDASAFAIAYGAAVVPDRDALALHVNGVADASGPPAWRLATAAVAACAMLAAATVAPVLRDAREVRAAHAELRRIAAERSTAVVDDVRLRDAAATLAALDAFATSRRSTTATLATFADALPPRTALAALRLDDSTGTATVTGAEAAATAAALRRAPDVASVEVVGAVTRERRHAASPAPVSFPTSATPGAVHPGMAAAADAAPPAGGIVERATLRVRFATPTSAKEPRP